jgi:hypothetical protein
VRGGCTAGQADLLTGLATGPAEQLPPPPPLLLLLPCTAARRRDAPARLPALPARGRLPPPPPRQGCRRRWQAAPVPRPVARRQGCCSQQRRGHARHGRPAGLAERRWCARLCWVLRCVVCVRVCVRACSLRSVAESHDTHTAHTSCRRHQHLPCTRTHCHYCPHCCALCCCWHTTCRQPHAPPAGLRQLPGRHRQQPRRHQRPVSVSWWGHCCLSAPLHTGHLTVVRATARILTPPARAAPHTRLQERGRQRRHCHDQPAAHGRRTRRHPAEHAAGCRKLRARVCRCNVMGRAAAACSAQPDPVLCVAAVQRARSCLPWQL